MQTEDMALEEYEPCFFTCVADDMDVFYEDILRKDLFKKFELLTPPQSPSHDPFPPDIQTNPTVDKRLEDVSASLNNSDSDTEDCHSLTVFNDFTSNLIQDCMWSGPCLAAAGLIVPESLLKKSSKSSNSGSPREDSPDTRATGDIKCVSPAAVFPYPTSELCRRPVHVELPTHCSSELGSIVETPSPSESEDDEEEIDVVTVVNERMLRKRRLPFSQSPTITGRPTLSSHLAVMHNYSNTHSQVSYSAPQSPQTSSEQSRETSSATGHKRRPLSMPASPQPASKKARSLLHSADLNRVAQKLKMGHSHQTHNHHISRSNAASRSSSDSEDCDKRAQHNVLERKRRNDLKYSFLQLRDSVPELTKQERTPKVTILKLSADYVRKLATQNLYLEKEMDRYRLRHEHMKRKLASLQRDCL